MKKLIAVALILCLLLSLSGCIFGKEPKSEKPLKHSLVIVIQNTANTAKPMLNSAEVISRIYAAAHSDGSTITLIEADGEGYTVDTLSVKIQENLSENKKDQIANAITDQAIQIAQSAKPRTGEVDTVNALILAARNVDASADVKVVLYLGSALPTSGTLQFATYNLLEASPEYVINLLETKKAIPSFPEGTQVIFAGVGDVAAPQHRLTYANVDMLKTMWKQVCEAGGAEVDFITATPTGENDAAEFPTVSPVVVVEDVIRTDDTKFETGVTFDNRAIPFRADDYTLADESVARNTLEPLVQLLKNTDDKILIAGTTARVGENASCVAFSRKRAQTVASLMADMGIDASRIRIVGLGYEHKNHIPDLNADGTLDEQSAYKNRRVLIMPLNSADTTLLLNSAGIRSVDNL